MADSVLVVDDGSVESTIIVRAMAERVHGMEPEEVTHTTHPEPVQRAVCVHPDVACVPRNARKIAKAALASGWSVRVTHAVGYGFDTKTGGVKTRAIKEPTGELTPTGRPAMKEIDHVQADPVNSIRVVIQSPDRILAGHWVDDGWDCGLALAGHVVLRNCNWSQLWKEFTDAQSRTDMRGETQLQLSLSSDGGQPL